jgi:hypothetical protein
MLVEYQRRSRRPCLGLHCQRLEGRPRVEEMFSRPASRTLRAVAARGMASGRSGPQGHPIHPNLEAVPVSPTLAISEASREMQEAGRKVHKLGLGQSPFPVYEPMVEEVGRDCAVGNSA